MFFVQSTAKGHIRVIDTKTNIYIYNILEVEGSKEKQEGIINTILTSAADTV